MFFFFNVNCLQKITISSPLNLPPQKSSFQFRGFKNETPNPKKRVMQPHNPKCALLCIKEETILRVHY